MKKIKHQPVRQRGQAMTETLVASLAIVPLFVVTPYMGKYLDIKAASTQTARYAAMERTVYSSGNWNIGENTKTKSQIETEIKTRVLSDPGSVYTTSSDTSRALNSLHVSYTGDALVTDYEVLDTLAETSNGLIRGAVVEGLFIGKKFDGINWAKIIDLPLFNKNRQGFITTEVSLSAKAISATERGSNGGVSSEEDIVFSDQLALITDTWMPGSEATFQQTLSGLTLDSTLGWMTIVGCQAFTLGGATILFRDGKDCDNTDLESETNVQLDKYMDQTNKRGRGQ